MRTIRRLLAAALFALVSLSAHASFPPSSGYSYGGYPTMAAYCATVPLPPNVTGYSDSQFVYSDSSYDYYQCLGVPTSGIYAVPYGFIARTNPGSCGRNATNNSGTCSCNAGYSDSAHAGSCVALAPAPSPWGSTAPTSNWANDPNVAGAVGLAGALAIAGSIFLGPEAPPIVAAALASAGLIGYTAGVGSMGMGPTAQSTVDSTNGPMIVHLAPAAGDSGSSGSASPSSSAVPTVSTAADGTFIPTGGGAASGGATGGWTQQNSDWYYYAPGSTQPSASITNNGYQYSQTSVSNGTSTSEVIQRYTDGSTVITKAANIPVTTSTGQATTATVQSTQSYDSAGNASGTTGYTIGSTLGNGNASGNGVGLSPNAGSGNGQGGTVKIDESGTASHISNDHMGELNTALDKRDGMLGKVTDTSGMDTSWGVTPFWLQNSGGCHPVYLYTLPNFVGGRAVTLDICPMLPFAQVLLTFLWTFWTFIAVVNMVQRVTSAGLA